MEIIQAAEALLLEQNGELRLVSARQVQKRSGGSNKRVNEIVGAWKEAKAAELAMPGPSTGLELIVPDAVRRVIDDTTDKLRALGPIVARMIDEAGRVERQRCAREMAAEQEHWEALREELEKDLHSAQAESRGYSEDLDTLEAEQAQLRVLATQLQDDLTEARQAKEDASREAVTLRASLAEAERTSARLAAQLETASEAHRSDLADSRRAYREELDAFRADYKESQEQRHKVEAELAGTHATIRQLQEQLARRV